MKFILTIAALATAFFTVTQTAQAMVQQDGAFLPSMCGQRQGVFSMGGNRAIMQICIGNIAGEQQGLNKAVLFHFNDNSNEVFHVAKTSDLLIMLLDGNVKSVFYLVGQSGQQVGMKVIQNSRGVVLSAAGTIDGVSYLVPSFETIFTTQGI